jgi:penicillin amidase
MTAKKIMIIRFIIGLVATAILLVGGILLFGKQVKDRALAKYEGEVTIEGLKNPIEIYRDSFAIPHISAGTDEDAYFGLGYAQAQERLFQMDFTRRIGRGLLSEVLGEKSLIIDKWARTIGFSRIAYYMWQHASADTKKYITAFTAGVNAFITSHHGKFGMEFDALSYEPELWKPTDCMLIGRLLSWEMNFSYWTDAAFSDIALAIDSAHLASLYPGYPSDAPTVMEGYNYSRPAPKILQDTSVKKDSSALSEFYDGQRKIHSALESIFSMQGLGGGSNAVAIAGKRTVSGGALLENDLHLAISQPARWYLVHIESKTGLNVAGFTVPGIPLILSGRNLNISWGLTNGMIDECDYFILKTDSSGEGYYTPSGIKPITSVTEHIPVRTFDGSGTTHDEKMTVKLTDNGPVISDMNIFQVARAFVSDKKTQKLVPKDETVNGRNPMIAIQWNGIYALTDELGCFFKMHRAKSIAEARTDMTEFATPCLNLAIAEAKTNDISYQIIGRLPIRNGSEERAMLPRHAASAYDAWSGFSKDLPYAVNPPNGYFVTANNPGSAYRPLPQSENWEPPGRAQRLVQLVEYYKKIDVPRMEQILSDTTSPFEKNELASHLIRIYRSANPDTSHKNDVLFNAALDYLENWDGAQGRYDISTSIVNAFFLRLITNALSDELGTERLAEFAYLNNIPPRTIGNLLKDPNNIWWDDIRTPQRETRDDIIKRSFEEAIVYLKSKLGSDIRTWNWGRMHWLTYKHPFADESKEVAALGNVDIGYAPGGLTTVVQSSYGFWNPFFMRVGPSMRSVADMKTDILYAALPTGNSGNMFNPHYRDMVDRFQRSDLIPVSLTKTDPAWKKLTLLPE